MPELPEVETVRRGLNHVTTHHTIEQVEVLYPRTIGAPNPEEFIAGLEGQTITTWNRRGKYLIAQLVQTNTASNEISHLGVHLRMTGQLLWVFPEDPLQKHTRVRLLMSQQAELRFVDQRTFGQMWWIAPEYSVESVMTGLQKLGPEPFSEEFSLAYFQAALKNRKRPIKTALLDQSIVAGVGNIYADEALFMSGIRPTTLCEKLTRPNINKLHQAIQEVLQNSIDAGGTTFSNFTGVMGVNGNYGGQAWVYGRKQKPCKICDAEIEQIKLAGRSAHFCPQCQR